MLRTDDFTIRSPDHEHSHEHRTMTDRSNGGCFAMETGFGQATFDFVVRLRTKHATSREVSRLFFRQFMKRFLSHFKLSFFKIFRVECTSSILAHLYNKVNSKTPYLQGVLQRCRRWDSVTKLLTSFEVVSRPRIRVPPQSPQVLCSL